MKILLTTDTWVPTVNGVVRSVELLYHELLRLGHDVRVLTLSDTSKSYQDGNVFYLGSVSADKVYPDTRIGLRLFSHWLGVIEEWGPDIIHSQTEFSTFIPACELVRRCGCPLVHTYHTKWEDYTHYLIPSERIGKATAEFCTRVVAGYCYGIITPTDKIRTMLEGYGVKCPLFTVPTGIDLRAFQPVQDGGTERRAMREELGLPEDAAVLVAVGRLAAEKDHEKLLDLLAERDAAKRPWLVFVGDGPNRAKLEAQTHRLGLDSTVRFVGMVAPEQVPRWYRMGDAFVCASQTETQGLTYFEALACGLPAICRADPCLDGVIVNGVNGWQWRTDAEFFDALDTLYADEALHEKLTQGALETAARYSSEHFAQQVLAVYREAIDNPHPKKDSVLPDVPKAFTELVESLKG